MTGAWVWFEPSGSAGELLPAERAAVPVADRGFWLGDGLFESVLVWRGALPLLSRHLARLSAGLDVLGFPPPRPAAELAERCVAVVAANGVDSGWLRLAVSRGEGPRGFAPPAAAQPLLLIQAGTAGPTGTHAGTHAGTHSGMHAGWAPWRVDPAYPGCRLKSLSGLDKVLARREAARRGLDELLWCNTAGEVAEGAATNLFCLVDGVLHTPHPDCGLLPGVARGLVLELTAAAGMAVAESRLHPADLERATEAFLTNAVLGIVPLLSVEGAAVGGDATAGPLTRRLQGLYQQRLDTLSAGGAVR